MLGLEPPPESGGPPPVVGVDPPPPGFGVVVAGVVPGVVPLDGVVVVVGRVVVVVDAAVTVNVCGVYTVVNDGTHTAAVTGEGPALASGGTTKAPCQEPLAATGTCSTTPSAVTATTLLGEGTGRGAQPVPLTFTLVPGGPDAGDMSNDEGAAWAMPADHHPSGEHRDDERGDSRATGTRRRPGRWQRCLRSHCPPRGCPETPRFASLACIGTTRAGH